MVNRLNQGKPNLSEGYDSPGDRGDLKLELKSPYHNIVIDKGYIYFYGKIPNSGGKQAPQIVVPLYPFKN